MDLFVRDENFRRIDIIDEFESFIWTERFNELGDFKLVAYPSPKLKSLLKNRRYLTHPDSDVIMRIEDILDASKDGKSLIAVTGRSIETIFENRGVSKNWIGSGDAAAAIANLVQIICVDGTGISPNDKITGFVVQNLVGSSMPVETTATNGQSLYKAVRELADSAGVGFKIAFEYGVYISDLIFKVYAGTTRNNLLFSVDNDTLINPSYLQSIANYKNIAYVTHPQGTKIIARPGTDINISGIARRVLSVDAMDVDPADHVPAVYEKILQQRGLNALYSDEGRMHALFDGEVPMDVGYRYRKDYFMGDKVWFQAPGDVKQLVRITEFIWSCDGIGTTAYPTFSVVD